MPETQQVFDGRFRPQFKSVCASCFWMPPKMSGFGPRIAEEYDEMIAHHFSDEHDGMPVLWKEMPICNCETVMETVLTRPTGGNKTKNYYKCPNCGQEGSRVIE